MTVLQVSWLIILELHRINIKKVFDFMIQSSGVPENCKFHKCGVTNGDIFTQI